MNEYIKILIQHIENYDMINSIVFNDERQIIFDKIISIRKVNIKIPSLYGIRVTK